MTDDSVPSDSARTPPTRARLRRFAPLLLLALALGCASSGAPPSVVAVRPSESPSTEVASVDDDPVERAAPEPESWALCRGGDDEACRRAFADSVPDEVETLRTIYGETCAAHAPAACAAFAWLSPGLVHASERAQALASLRARCRTDGSACDSLGDYLGDDLVVEHDEAGSREAYDAGCALDHARSCADAATLRFFRARGDDDRVRAIALAERACELAPTAGCAILGDLLLDARSAGAYDPGRGVALLAVTCRSEGVGCERLIDAVITHRPAEVTLEEAVAWSASSPESQAEPWSAEAYVATEALCPRAATNADDSRALTAFEGDAARALRRPGVSVVARLPRGVRRSLEALLAPIECARGNRYVPRWIRPLRRAQYGVDLVVEWIAVAGDESATMHHAHVSVVRIAGGRLSLRDDVSFSWQYLSMGLTGWWRSTRDDLDLDGIPDVVVVQFDGFDDSNSDTIVYASSGTGLLATVSLGSNESTSADGCFVPSADGPALIVAALDAPLEGDDPRRISCVAAARFDRVRGPVRVPVRATLGEPSPIDEDEDEIPVTSLAALARARGGSLGAFRPFPDAPHAGPRDDVDPEALEPGDARWFAADPPSRRLGVCADDALFPVLGFDDEGSFVTHANLATVSLGGPDDARVVAPEVGRDTFCDTFP